MSIRRVAMITGAHTHRSELRVALAAKLSKYTKGERQSCVRNI